MSEHPAEMVAQMALLRTEGIGPRRATALLDVFGSARAIYAANDDELLLVDGMTDRLVGRMRAAYRNPALAEERRAALNAGYSLLSVRDRRYPALLKSIYAPPALIWTMGDPAFRPGPSIAIVGTRRPSPGGKHAAYALAFELAQSGFTIVSGMAYGIDSVAHRAALDAGGRTVAVLGSGLRRIYPKRNARLASEISRSGAVVSEFPLGMEARPGHFPRRNRIISGMAECTVVVEAYEKGGALLTARIALDQNRDVYAVPGIINNPAAAGTNRLIQHGEAALLTGARELILAYGVDAHSQADGASGADGAGSTGGASDSGSVPNLDASLLHELKQGPVHIDTLGRTLDRSTADLLIELLQLECRGFVRQLPGKFFHLSVEAADALRPHAS
jgi:DNA processing protein